MKKLSVLFISFSLLTANLFSDSKETKVLTIIGFYLGMNKEEVKTIYEDFQKQKVAKYISIENEKYRDMIKLDNEFSSMGNKIDIFYEESGKANSIHFQYKTAIILFEAEKLTPEEFVEKFKKEYNIPNMEFKDLGIVKSWIYIDEKTGTKLSIDDNKNVKLQYEKKK